MLFPILSLLLSDVLYCKCGDLHGGHNVWSPQDQHLVTGITCWVGSTLSFPVGFSSNLKKEAPIWVPGTSIRSVSTLTGEGINTHTHECENNVM